MRADRECPTRGGAPRRRIALLAAALALAGLDAGAADLNARGELTWAQDEAIGSSSEYLRQTYDFDFRRQVTLPISYRLSFRLQEDAGVSRTGGMDYPLHVRTLTPTAAFDYRIPEAGVSASYRLNDERRLDAPPGTDPSRAIERTTLGLLARPFERGDATLGLDRLAYTSASTRTVDNRLGLAFRYTSPSLRLSSEGRVLLFEDYVRHTSRLSVGPRVTAAWSGPVGQHAQLSTGYVLDAYRTEQTMQGSTVTQIPISAEPIAGLLLIDSLPDDTPPMTPEPRLVDRSLDVGAGAALGPVGASFYNLALDLGRVGSLDELRVHVRSSTGALVPFGGAITWTVYSSLDGLSWIPATAGLATFDATLSAYVIPFTATPSRYFKAVNFGQNTVETIVTELEGYFHETYRPDETRVSSLVRQGLTLTVTARPSPLTQLNYSGQLNANAFSSSGGPTRWSNDATNTVTASFGPHTGMQYDGKLGVTTVRQPGGYTQDSIATALSVQYRPIDQYRARFDARYALDDVRMSSAMKPVRALNLGSTVGTDAKILPALDVGISAGLSRQQIVGGGTTDYLTGNAYARGPVLRSLDLALAATVQRILSTRGDTSAQLFVPLFRVLTYQLYVAELQYRPSTQLDLWARVGHTDTGQRRGLIQSYRANWYPFPGGSIQLAFQLSQEIDPLTGQSFRRASATPRWDLNPHASLDLSYNMARGIGAVPQEQQNLYLTFRLRL